MPLTNISEYLRSRQSKTIDPGKYLATRLNQNADRMQELDSEPITYIYVDGGTVADIPAQIGRSSSELLMGDGMMTQSMNRDYIFLADSIRRPPNEGDLINDSMYQCKVVSQGGQAPYRWTNETSKRYRVHTIVLSKLEDLHED